MNDEKNSAAAPPAPLTSPSPESLVQSVKTVLTRLDPQIEAAFLNVPRQHFLPAHPPDQVYNDAAIPTKTTLDGLVLSSSSQPSMMAIMLEQLQLRPGDNVLEIGAGTGYNAAMIQYMVGEQGHVTSVEIDKEVAEIARTNLQRAAMTEVSVVTGDGIQGYAPRAAYDRILATAAIWDVPRAWVRQLRPNGRLVAPVLIEGFQMSGAFVAQRDGTLMSSDNHVCAFVWMQGQRSHQGVQLPGGVTIRIAGGLFLDTAAPMDSAAVANLLAHDAEDGYLADCPRWVDLWQGLLPYLALNLPAGMHLASYRSANRDYGIEGGGFALFSPGSACFVQLSATPKVRYFGAAETYLTLQDSLAFWNNAGRPDQRRIRLRFIPVDAQPAGQAPGRVFLRGDHLLQVWLEP